MSHLMKDLIQDLVIKLKKVQSQLRRQKVKRKRYKDLRGKFQVIYLR